MSTPIPDSHPRAASLRLRERIVEGVRLGLATEVGLVAHGRGEAFDYLLGEKTHDFARRAIEAASALITTARHPVISVNGNVASLAGQQLAALVQEHPRVKLEVNIFYHSPERAERIARHLQQLGAGEVLNPTAGPSVELPGLDHARRHMHVDGIARADVVLVPLEDGDRCQALVRSGRTVIVIDLNPLSRSAACAHVTVVDELTRAVGCLQQQLARDASADRSQLEQRIGQYDNAAVLAEAVAAIRAGV